MISTRVALGNMAASMEIGNPTREYLVEPVEDPVPREHPVPEPEPEPEVSEPAPARSPSE
jgi:hypothetical protein